MLAIDLSKLADLRERHTQLHDTYRGASQRARDMASEAERLVSDLAIAADPEAAPPLLSLPAEKLALVPVATLTKASLDERGVLRVVTAKQRAARQARVAEGLAIQFRSSVALIERLNEYAVRFEYAPR
jgi:hypothetical protein